MDLSTDRLVTIPQAANFLGIRAGTARLWVRRGYIPATRLGKRALRIKLADLVRLVEAGRVDPRRGRR